MSNENTKWWYYIDCPALGLYIMDRVSMAMRIIGIQRF